jgi:hypothetical protein
MDRQAINHLIRLLDSYTDKRYDSRVHEQIIFGIGSETLSKEQVKFLEDELDAGVFHMATLIYSHAWERLKISYMSKKGALYNG